MTREELENRIGVPICVGIYERLKSIYDMGFIDGEKAAIKELEQETKTGWIPVTEKLPEEGEGVLVWYEYFRYGNYNCMWQTYGIGWQYDEHFSVDNGGVKQRVIAWQPLPKPYQSEVEE